MEPHLHIQSDQERLAPDQETEARRFAQERIAAQLSTESVDEPETERLLQQAYVAAGLPPPTRILWLDGPLHLVVKRAPESAEVNVWDRLHNNVWESVNPSVRKSVGESVRKSVWSRVGDSVIASVKESVEDRMWASVLPSVEAYFDADGLAFFRFFDEYLAPNGLHALAHFNERVSGYWLGQDTALLVRRPTTLARDSQGRLHHSSGKCIEYSDGWGFYAWHGVRVPERAILAPETLTREDFLKEQNVEVRRVIQERMGARFVLELGGQVIDTGPRGTLYEVRLPEDDPERVARYVQVQDASSLRAYFLRVPPTIQTAAEAVAWSFGLASEDYHPAQET